jgi:hypothetical protein
MTVEDLQQARTRFAKEIQQQGHIKSTGLIEGLATVTRELRRTGALEDRASR